MNALWILHAMITLIVLIREEVIHALVGMDIQGMEELAAVRNMRVYSAF